MDKILEGLPKSLQVFIHKKANEEFLAVNVEDIEEKDVSRENISVGKMELSARLRKWLTEKEAIDAGSTSSNVLVNSIKKNLSLYTSRDSSPVCIYNVPAKLGKENEEAYTPRSNSIGPIHHGRPELKAMERYKWRFLDRYLKESSVSLNFLVQTTYEMENQVRQCYQETFDNLSSEEFSEMILLDGIFLTVLLQKNEKVIMESLPHSVSLQIYKNYWVGSEIMHDLMLLENQLPLFVLQKFHKYMGGVQLKLEESISKFFSGVGNIGTLQEKKDPSTARHLVDFLRIYYQPKNNLDTRGKVVYNRSATELHEAGVKFQMLPHHDIFEIGFLEGKLGIPILRIDEHVETLFRNFIAFEQCQYDERKDITSYVIFMESLINTTKDVDLLVDCGIIQNNYYGDHECVASLFDNLHKETVRPDSKFYFEELCTELNDYSKDFWHQWKAKWFRSKKVLRRKYLNNPWSIISIIAAIILLMLTMVQTICSIVSIRQGE